MRLAAVELQGFRRFEEPSRLDLGGDLVALVGPNEAGKSSILQAMLALNDDVSLSSRDRTRGYEYAAQITAHYVLDDEDRRDLAEIEGARDVRWWTLRKWESKNTEATLHPEPQRDLGTRWEWAEALAPYTVQEQTKQISEAIGRDIDQLLRAGHAALSSDKQDLTEKELAAVRELGSLHDAIVQNVPDDLEESDPVLRHLLTGLAELLSDLEDYDEGIHPREPAGALLMRKRPRFVQFGKEDRELRSTYELDEIGKDPPRALTNLAALADLDLNRLLRAVKSEDYGEQETIIREANARLAQAYHASWQQSDVSVQFAVRETFLVILATLPGTDRAVSQLEDRSDGLRAFVALRSFIAGLELPTKPVVLIDEAETHLHYDAQADMVDVFTGQTEAAKIIYTTHSAGCLPRDLGTGVRVVMPDRNKERSSVKNSVWQGSDAGFTPVAFAMGATVFAFLPARHVVMVEGPSDAMLLPTLFREASGARAISFQIAPGLAPATQANFIELANEGGKVRFLADGDDAGLKYLRDLYEFGVRETHLFSLGEAIGNNVMLEDLIDATHYAAAVNYFIETFCNVSIELPVACLPTIRRVEAMESWCSASGITPPDKKKIAQRLLDMKSEAERQGMKLQLLAPGQRVKMAKLHSRIEDSFAPQTTRRQRRLQSDILSLLRGVET